MQYRARKLGVVQGGKLSQKGEDEQLKPGRDWRSECQDTLAHPAMEETSGSGAGYDLSFSACPNPEIQPHLHVNQSPKRALSTRTDRIRLGNLHGRLDPHLGLGRLTLRAEHGAIQAPSGQFTTSLPEALG